ncbi:polyamine aminopropyltransferase [Acetivibrio cellulolyticus]|uniref:polyamine aminopropyltransferase n=1 Tax=Acetivibrio cellulolyticus TaxID=35830 RepID=UPI0001E30149|nr:polyamine aminopropyltransferase [Acetivibrio cellulolyticus]
MQDTNEKKFDGRLLLVATLLISICSIIYELMISSISTYLNGDSIKQFSVTIGLYMSAMGIGSYISKFVKENLFNKFIFIELSTGLLGGFSTFILFMSNIYTKIYYLVMYLIIIAIGILVGLEIPLLTRIIEENNSNIRINLANIFTFDYIGGLLGSLAFPLILFPQLGFITTSFLVGCINIFVSFLILYKYRMFIKSYKKIRIIIIVAFLIITGFLLNGGIIATKIEDGLYRDDIIYSKQTMYQKIVMTKHKDDLRLFLDGNIQFSSVDEYRYHEALVHIPFMFAKNHQRILILGGGDGLAAREMLKYKDVKEIVLVDIDAEMTELCKNNKQIAGLNEASLSDKKVTILNEDAYLYVSKNENKFDVIVIDLPDPNTEVLNKLYTNVFYNYVKANLNKDGVAVVQSTSPYYAKKSFWCINKTLSTQFKNVIPYHIQVPAFGEWGFNLVYDGEVSTGNLEIQTKYLTDENIKSLFVFGKDEKVDLDTIKINDMFKPALIEYYNNDVENW